MDNFYTKWAPSRFVDQPQYSGWSEEKKAEADRDERLRVATAPLGDVIAVCPSPEAAQWVSGRLNLAASMSWISVDASLPDDCETVIFALSDGDIWTGYLEAGDWFYVSDDKIESASVTHWLRFPELPGLKESGVRSQESGAEKEVGMKLQTLRGWIGQSEQERKGTEI